MRKNTIHLLVFFSLYMSICQPASAQFSIKDSFFVYLGGQYYVLPNLADMVSPDMAERYGISAGIIPDIGFRVGAGLELEKWRFSVESGYTYINGDNPLVLNIDIIPLMLKAGYSFFPFSNYDRFSLMPTAAFGVVFSDVEHYKDVIDLLTDNLSRSSNMGFLFQAGFQIGWEPPLGALDRMFHLYAGFSVDCIMENDGVIPLPQVELGILIRPFAKKSKTVIEPPAVFVPEEIIELEIEEIEEEEIETEIEIEEIEIEEELVLVKEVYLVLFPPDETELYEESLDMLAAATQAIADFDSYHILIQGYAAPYVSASGQSEVSRQRAQNIATILIEEYNIPRRLVTVEWHGSSFIPENIERNSHSGRRSVEIIIQGWKRQ